MPVRRLAPAQGAVATRARSSAGLGWRSSEWPSRRPSTPAPSAAAPSPKWQGQCPHCGAWNTLVESVATPAPTRFATVAGARSPVRALASIVARERRACRPGSTNSTACWGADWSPAA